MASSSTWGSVVRCHSGYPCSYSDWVTSAWYHCVSLVIGPRQLGASISLARHLSSSTALCLALPVVSVALTEYHRMVTSQHANDSPHVHVGDIPSLCFGHVHVSPLPSTSPDSLTSTWSHADNLLSCISGKHVPCIHILAETSNPERPRSWYRICSTSYYDVMIVAQADSMHSQL